ncbi:hypothetical protein A2737_00435 [Candidatus Nomurabacteria bacterium RIFCSPHIGHO2_01_FULL_41_71]|nr:MAG: hypothetical protein A2737_00435 [Candidatus Nomurabacteria bacterium RIFCSPHIGHO2_01_FULL_41_71]OGI89505.1 MAG: hypothetical protein A3B01_02355 [Candidatus Nomurabacteria bacterium RIFCSPLOWO2_01_FULL_41_52b]
MINLIPNEEKKFMIKDFYYRLVAVFFFSLSLVIFFASVAILPAYLFSSVKKNEISAKLKIEMAEPTSLSDQETFLAVDALDTKLSLIEKAEKDKFLVSERIINKLLVKKISGIKITKIFFEENSALLKNVNVRGSAESREKLLLFRRALEEDATFQKIDLPISNFVKGSDIQFYLSFNVL